VEVVEKRNQLKRKKDGFQVYFHLQLQKNLKRNHLKCQQQVYLIWSNKITRIRKIILGIYSFLDFLDIGSSSFDNSSLSLLYPITFL